MIFFFTTLIIFTFSKGQGNFVLFFDKFLRFNKKINRSFSRKWFVFFFSFFKIYFDFPIVKSGTKFEYLSVVSVSQGENR